MTFKVRVDAAIGCRITSLRDPAGFEWCWSRPDPRRDEARPGSRFVDVGGIEECFPTLAGIPDHGEVWSVPWFDHGNGSCSVRTEAAVLRRSISAGPELTFSYRLEAAPGYAFIWAFHMLVVPSVDLEIDLPSAAAVRSWPDGYDRPWRETRWPSAAGIDRFDRLESDDGSATFAIVPDVCEVGITTGKRRMQWRLRAPDQPVAIGLWRNLGGYSWDDTVPYRSIGIEPMVGRHPSRATAPQEEAGRVGDSGVVEWSLTVKAGPAS